ncbi:hypothetical protein ABIC90_000851 [Variovorax boronicumulans]
MRGLAQALSSKTFDLNLRRFGRSVRESPVSPVPSILAFDQPRAG